jgi:MFS family permease
MEVKGSVPPAGPLRRLAIGSFVTSLGDGAWFASYAVFFIRVVKLSPPAVGFGLLLAGVLGTVLSTPAGHLADRRGPRGVVVALLLVESVSFLGYALIDGLPGFLLVATVTGATASAGVATRRALVAGLTAGPERLRALATQRVASHAGQAIGAAAGALVISLDQRAVYLVLIYANACTFAIQAAIVAGVPKVAPTPREHARAGLIVLRDRPYIALAALMGVLTLCWSMLSTGVPLWVALHSHAPQATSAVVVMLNCIGIVAFQSRVARRADSPANAARTALIAGLTLAASCLIFAAAGALSATAAAALIFAAGCVHLTGELLYVSASWGLSLSLMREDARGQYQGVFATGEAAAITVGPAVMTTLVAGGGAPGWAVLGAVFVAAGATTIPVTRWALRVRSDGDRGPGVRAREGIAAAGDVA